MLELTALPSLPEDYWVPMVRETDVLLVSYWKSMEHLLAYAKLRTSEHLPAWRAGIFSACSRTRPGL